MYKKKSLRLNNKNKNKISKSSKKQKGGWGNFDYIFKEFELQNIKKNNKKSIKKYKLKGGKWQGIRFNNKTTNVDLLNPDLEYFS